MDLIPVDPSTAPEAAGGYVNALCVEGASRLLFISGQIPQTREGHVPDGIEDQCRLVWSNLVAALTVARMDVTNLVKVTTFSATAGTPTPTPPSAPRSSATTAPP